MPDLWVWLALGAGTFQTARNGLARSLSGSISPALNSWSRFAFNLPFSTLLVAALVARQGLPSYSASFFFYCLLTGLTQLLGNVALVSAFRHSLFVESIVLHKLEIVFAALLGAAVFGETPAAAGWIGIFVCAIGVLAINLARDGGAIGWRRAFHFDLGALLAITAGLLLVFASFALKAATGELAANDPRVAASSFEAASHTLFHTTWIEVAILSAFLLVRTPRELLKVSRYGGRMLAIGLAGFSGSLCWFWAYSLTLVAYVKAVGQIETVLSVLLGLLVWREARARRQLPGIALVVAGILIVLLA
jgi:drug/metabolite transporter (DMT)-like permease